MKTRFLPYFLLLTVSLAPMSVWGAPSNKKPALPSVQRNLTEPEKSIAWEAWENRLKAEFILLRQLGFIRMPNEPKLNHQSPDGLARLVMQAYAQTLDEQISLQRNRDRPWILNEAQQTQCIQGIMLKLESTLDQLVPSINKRSLLSEAILESVSMACRSYTGMNANLLLGPKSIGYKEAPSVLVIGNTIRQLFYVGSHHLNVDRYPLLPSFSTTKVEQEAEADSMRKTREASLLSAIVTNYVKASMAQPFTVYFSKHQKYTGNIKVYGKGTTPQFQLQDHTIHLWTGSTPSRETAGIERLKSVSSSIVSLVQDTAIWPVSPYP